MKMVLKTECGSVKLDGIAFSVDRDIWPTPTFAGLNWPINWI